MANPSDYGRNYWCIKVTEDLSQDGEIYAHADEVVTNANGSLALVRHRDDAKQVTLLIAPGQWLAVYAASLLDGSAVSVEHWKGEVDEE